MPAAGSSGRRRRRAIRRLAPCYMQRKDRAVRMRPRACSSRPPKRGCRRVQGSIAVVPSFSIHLPLRSTGFHRLPPANAIGVRPDRYYEEIRLLHGPRPVVVASFGSTARGNSPGGPMQTSLGKNTGCPAAAVPTTDPTSVGFWASRSWARSPGRIRLLRASLAFGAAVRLGLLPHTASRRQAWRLTTASSACSCLRLAVATNSPREGLSPPIQCPCQAHPCSLARASYAWLRSRRQEAALLTRPAPRGLLEGSGRRAS